MTVEAIRLRNFMAFEDTGWIELAPICLLFGRNSSGKSVISRALRLLRQSLGDRARDGALSFFAEDGLDQGSWLDAVHRHEESRTIGFAFRCTLASSADLLRRRLNDWRRVRGQPALTYNEFRPVAELVLTYRLDRHRDQPELVETEVACVDASAPGNQQKLTLFGAQRLDDETAYQVKADWWFWSDLLAPEEPGRQQSAWQDWTLSDARGIVPDMVPLAGRRDPAPSANVAFVRDLLTELRETIERFLHGIVHLGPLRPPPKRWYVLDRAAQMRWEGEGWTDFLRFLTHEADEQTYQRLGTWLERLKLAPVAEIVRLKTPREAAAVAQVTMKEPRIESGVNMADTGSGVAQVVPVLLAALDARPDSLVIIEQPELHLHPAAQADLADLFVQGVRRLGENGSRARFLLETHSENLILRLRRRLAETCIGQKEDEALPYALWTRDFGVYFIERRGPVSTCHRIAYDALGRYVEQPEGFRDFFGQDFEELAALDDARFLAGEAPD